MSLKWCREAVSIELSSSQSRKILWRIIFLLFNTNSTFTLSHTPRTLCSFKLWQIIRFKGEFPYTQNPNMVVVEDRIQSASDHCHAFLLFHYWFGQHSKVWKTLDNTTKNLVVEQVTVESGVWNSRKELFVKRRSRETIWSSSCMELQLKWPPWKTRVQYGRLYTS